MVRIGVRVRDRLRASPTKGVTSDTVRTGLSIISIEIEDGLRGRFSGCWQLGEREKNHPVSATTWRDAVEKRGTYAHHCTGLVDLVRLSAFTCRSNLVRSSTHQDIEDRFQRSGWRDHSRCATTCGAVRTTILREKMSQQIRTQFLVSDGEDVGDRDCFVSQGQTTIERNR